MHWKSDLDPFQRAFKLGLFFYAVWCYDQFNLIFEIRLLLSGATNFGSFTLKAGFILGIGKFKKLSIAENLTFAVGLSQVGNFSFVTYAICAPLGNFWIRAIRTTYGNSLRWVNDHHTYFDGFDGINSLLPQRHPNRMGATGRWTKSKRSIKVILVGFSHFGSNPREIFLRANGVEATVLDFGSRSGRLPKGKWDSKCIMEMPHTTGPTSPIRRSWRCQHSLISAIMTLETNRKLVESARKIFQIGNHDREKRTVTDGLQNWWKWARNKYLPWTPWNTSIRMGQDALKKLGFPCVNTVLRLGQSFRKSMMNPLWRSR